MKRTFVVAIAGLLAAALTSCDSTDPVASQEISGESVLAKANCGGEIALEQSIPLQLIGPVVSSQSQSGFISGSAVYGVGPSPILIRDMVSVSIQFQASVHALDGTDRVWNFSGTSTDQVALSVSDPTLLVKEYRTPLLSSQSRPFILYVRYEVTNCRVTVHSMWAAEGGLSISSEG
jgi:hypothetical protein